MKVHIIRRRPCLGFLFTCLRCLFIALLLLSTERTSLPTHPPADQTSWHGGFVGT